MVPYVLWMILVVSFLVSVRSVLDAVAKTAEAARAHEEDLVGEVSEQAGPRRSTRKEKLEFTSAMLNLLIGAIGMLVSAYNLINPPAPYIAAPDALVPVAWGVGALSSLAIVVFASAYLGKSPKRWKRKLVGEAHG